MSENMMENKIEMDINKNIELCLNFGYGTLKSAKTDSEYRNAIISIHNGLELLMKLYLQNKNKYLIYNKIDHYALMSERTDLIKTIDLKKSANTIKFSECIKILSYFEVIPES